MKITDLFMAALALWACSVDNTVKYIIWSCAAVYASPR